MAKRPPDKARIVETFDNFGNSPLQEDGTVREMLESAEPHLDYLKSVLTSVDMPHIYFRVEGDQRWWRTTVTIKVDVVEATPAEIVEAALFEEEIFGEADSDDTEGPTGEP